MEFCKPIKTLSEEKRKKFIVKFCALLKNRSNDQHVCNICLKDIKMNKTPKRSKKSKFRFANFPTYLVEKLKTVCNLKSGSLRKNVHDQENSERQVLKLNRLESYLLKLVIPFIRIVHCPRGSYFKVKGDLILISSDICHSLSKILPVDQTLIPVCFKRKLAYSGSYIEEYIQKSKLKMYFSWFKKYNHLYKDIELDSTLVECFKDESLKATKDFERLTKQDGDESSLSEAETDEEINEDDEHEITEMFTRRDIIEPCIQEGNELIRDQTTMFLNKYCEDTNIPSVANRLADTIIEYEINKGTPFTIRDDYEIDDECLSEEEYLRNVEEEDSNIQIEEKMEDIRLTHSEVNDEIVDEIDVLINPSEDQSIEVANLAQQHAKSAVKKMEKICVAPGEDGKFRNWNEDLFLEEQCFPEKFPYGTGGYLSSMVNEEEKGMGFANYCINQIMSCDPKFRQDCSYIFFILLVKELIQLKRCKTTYLRQATRLPNLSREDILNLEPSNLSRFNRSYQVFKNVRGTSMYYEESKKNLMAHLRQHGCPSIFLTLSCAEFDWPELLKEIVETVERRKVTKEYVENLPINTKNKLISENVVQSTVHFQKRIDKLFSLMKNDFFKGSSKKYQVSSYFYRVEFQQRGAPHIHSLLWMKDQDGIDAPNFCFDMDEIQEDSAEDNDPRSNVSNQLQQRIKEIEMFADFLMSTNPKEIKCELHHSNESEGKDCEECENLRKKNEKYQTHKHTFTCAKKRKTITIKETEGHGRKDGIMKGTALSNIQICRFRFPKFPLDETKFVLALPKDTEEELIKRYKLDLNKITKFLIRQTYSSDNHQESESFKTLKDLDFWHFLYEAGMFDQNKLPEEYSENEKQAAKLRYLNAIAVGIQGSGTVILKREVKDLFVNGFNSTIMKLHQANHDLQICVDQFSVAQYICGYLTKNESGISRLLKAVNEETNGLDQMTKLNALAAVLDKHREVSIQEAVYRILSLPMTKSSVKVKYLSNIHPNFRDGLLKGNVEELEETESIFHNSPHDYYENRPEESNEIDVIYDEEEKKKDYWKKLTLSEFWSRYEIVYDKNAKKNKKKQKTRIITLQNGSFIRRRLEDAVLRYYLNYDNDEDLARGLLILFHPFRNEMQDIHRHDVKQLLFENREQIESKRKLFEKYKVMTELIRNIQTDIENDDNKNEEDDSNCDDNELESTSPSDINDFNNWARNQAVKDLSSLKKYSDICDIIELRSRISALNQQQRRLFDDFTERMVSSDMNEKPCYLYLAGEAGTGKSHLVQLLIEAVKFLKIKSGAELKKPPVIVMAPTANAAFIVGGKTIDSALSFSRNDNDRYTEASASKMAMMKFQYEDVQVIFCDEISMVGSKKLTRINYRLQDLVEGSRKHSFMGGISFVASGIKKISVNLILLIHMF